MYLYFPLGLERGNCVRQSFLVKLNELLKWDVLVCIIFCVREKDLD